MFAPTSGRRARSRLSEKPNSLDPAARAPRRKTRLRLVHPAELPVERGGMPPRIARYLETAELPSPCLVVDVDLVEYNYLDLARSMPQARIFYAVKANPADEIVARLARLGSSFDAASLGEIDVCLAHGATPERISFGNTIKKQRDIGLRQHEQHPATHAFRRRHRCRERCGHHGAHGRLRLVRSGHRRRRRRRGRLCL